MQAYKFKYVCESCKAVHWYLPKDGCRNCGHAKLKKVSNETGKENRDKS